MSKSFDHWIQRIRAFIPPQRRRIASAFIFAGLTTVFVPFWQEIIASFLNKYLEVNSKVPLGLGIASIIVGIFIFFYSEYIEKRQPEPRISPEYLHDKNCLKSFFEEIHTPTLDYFIHWGKLSTIYLPFLYYFYGMKSFVTSSTFHIYDTKIKNLVCELNQKIELSLSYAPYFKDMPNPDLQKFDSRYDIFLNKQAGEAHKKFKDSIYAIEKLMQELHHEVMERYPGFDFAATNQAAFAKNKSYVSRAQQPN